MNAFNSLICRSLAVVFVLALCLSILGTMLTAIHLFIFFFSSRRRHTRFKCDWSSDVCSSDLSFALIRFSTSQKACWFADRLEPARFLTCGEPDQREGSVGMELAKAAIQMEAQRVQLLLNPGGNPPEAAKFRERSAAAAALTVSFLFHDLLDRRIVCRMREGVFFDCGQLHEMGSNARQFVRMKQFHHVILF